MRTPALLLLLAGIALTAPAPFLQAQIVGGAFKQRNRFNGRDLGDKLGWSVAPAGDVDGDGVSDMIVGAPFSKGSLGAAVGAAFVFSGVTGNPIREILGPKAGGRFGVSVAGAGDVDGDGFADLLVGATRLHPKNREEAGSVFLFSGATGTRILRLDGPAAFAHLGSSVAPAGDLDGDGAGDFFAGMPDFNLSGIQAGGSLLAFSGATGTLLWQFNGDPFTRRVGASLAITGDLDGDGIADVLAGAPDSIPNSVNLAGSVLLLSGASGALIRRFDGTEIYGRLGESVSRAGDVDGDGVEDLVAGAPFASPGGSSEAGSVLVFSGATGGLLFRFDGFEAGSRLGRSVAGPGDQDRDGIPDVAAGAPRTSLGGFPNTGSVFVFSSARGLMIREIDGFGKDFYMGGALAAVGDLDGDGLGDLLAGAIGAQPGGTFGQGSAFALAFNPILEASGEILSVSAGGTIDYAVDFPDADAGAPYQFLVSAHGTGPSRLNGLLIPLARDGFFRASRRGRTLPQAEGFQGVLDSRGRAAARVSVPPFALPAKLAGRRFPLQLAVVDAALDAVSVARRILFVP